jgi:hypothetical protein
LREDQPGGGGCKSCPKMKLEDSDGDGDDDGDDDGDSDGADERMGENPTPRSFKTESADCICLETL